MLHDIKKTIFAGFENRINGRVFELEETAKQATCRKAKFETDRDILVYKFDKTPKLNGEPIVDKFPFLNDLVGLKSMCDFMIFYPKEEKNTLFVVLCNLKSKNKHNNDDQLESGRIFAQFLAETVKRHTKQDWNLEFRRILFSETLLYKGTSKPQKSAWKQKLRNYISNADGVATCILKDICS